MGAGSKRIWYKGTHEPIAGSRISSDIMLHDARHTDLALDPPPELWAAAALLATEDGRYLMQLRDDKPGLRLANHWALFGGAVEAGETGEATLRRELREELSFAPRAVAWFAQSAHVLPRGQARILKLDFFVVPVTPAEIGRMVQREGADKRLFAPEALAQEPRVAPWDLAAVLMHARRQALFQ